MDTIQFVPDQTEGLSAIVEETFEDSMEDRMGGRWQTTNDLMGYQEHEVARLATTSHMDLMKDSESIADYHNEPQEEYSLLEKALDMSLLYAGCGPFRGGLSHNGNGSYSRYGDMTDRYGYNSPYRHPAQDLNPLSHSPGMDHVQRRIQEEKERREALYNNWATEQRKHDDPFIGGAGMKGIGSSVHFHGSDRDHLSKMHIDTGNPFGGNNDYDDDDSITNHPWSADGYKASMMDYNAQISNNINRFMNRNYFGNNDDD